MYNIQKINQAPVQKNLHSSRFSRQHFPTDYYTPTERQIHQLIISFGTDTSKKLSNAYIAQIVGCTKRTVTKATTKFHANGLITKQQEHQYDFNTYNIIQSEYFYPKKDLILVDSLSRSLCVVSYARTRGTHTKIQKYISKKGNKVNATQKHLILSNKKDPKIKEMLNSPQIREKIITPTIQLITDILSLDEKEQFKLVAFSEDTIEHTFAEVAGMVHTNTLPKKTNRMEWLLDIAKDYCTANSIKPDWKWYYELCDITGMDTKTKPKPLVIKHTKQHKQNNIQELSSDQQVAKLTAELKAREERLSLYGGSVLDKKTIERLKQEIENKTATKGKLSGYGQILRLPLDERISKLASELAIHQERYACYNGSEYMKGLLARMIERTKFDLNEAERMSDEKQIIPHTDNTNKLAEISEQCEPVLRYTDERQGFLWPIPSATAWG